MKSVERKECFSVDVEAAVTVEKVLRSPRVLSLGCLPFDVDATMTCKQVNIYFHINKISQ